MLLVSNNFPGMKLSMKLKDLRPLIADKYSDAFLQMLRLTSAAVAVPMSSSDCERGSAHRITSRETSEVVLVQVIYADKHGGTTRQRF
jgi:hypothetical protein